MAAQAARPVRTPEVITEVQRQAIARNAGKSLLIRTVDGLEVCRRIPRIINALARADPEVTVAETARPIRGDISLQLIGRDTAITSAAQPKILRCAEGEICVGNARS